jgi:putative phage-type endonuclease
MDRKNFIGSSEIAAALGMSRWKSPLKLWAEKVGEIEPDDLSDIEAVEWGKRLEEVVAKKFADKHKVKLMAYKKRYTHGEYPFLSCELDRIITGTEQIVEVKTCSAWKAREWDEEEIPTEYILQVQFAMGLSNRKKAWLIVLIGGQRYEEKELDFDAEMYEGMVKRAVLFWEDNVQKNIPPGAIVGDKDTLALLYPEVKRAEMIDVDVDTAIKLDALFINRQTAIDMVKEGEGMREVAENKIKEMVKEDQGVVTANFKATWKNQKRTYVDNKKLKDDNLYDKYSYSKDSRVLRVKELDKEE